MVNSNKIEILFDNDYIHINREDFSFYYRKETKHYSLQCQHEFNSIRYNNLLKYLIKLSNNILKLKEF